MDKLRHLKRQMMQQTLQAVGIADATDDDEFKSLLAINKDNSDQLVTVAKNLQRFKETTAASLDAALALAQSMEVYFQPEASTGAPPSDPASLLLARALLSSLGEVKGSTLPAVSSMFDSSRASLDKSLAAYGNVAPQVANRKTMMLEFDAYKRKVEALRAAPPNARDADKLPRNEEKLTKACTDLAAVNNELIETLVKLEKAKAGMVAGELRCVVDAVYLLHQQTLARLEPVLVKAGQAAQGTPGTPGAKAAATVAVLSSSSFGGEEEEEAEPPVMNFTPSVHVAHAEAKPAAHAHAPAAAPVTAVVEEEEAFSPFGAAPPAPPPAAAADFDFDDEFGAAPPPPPPPPSGAGGVLGVDDFDAFA